MGSAAGARRMALWLLLSLMPMLSFAGHWPTHIDIPGTDFYLTVPFAGAVDAAETGEHSHGEHCHEDAAGCSKTPSTAGVGFALMHESIAALGAGALLIAVAARTRRLRADGVILPEIPPPLWGSAAA